MSSTHPSARPIRSMVYLLANLADKNGVEAFARDPDTGALHRVGRYDTGGKGDPSVGGFGSHALATDGKHVYAVDPGSDGVSSFAIQPDGTLKHIGSVPSRGRRPVSLAVAGKYLYVLNQGAPPSATEKLAGSLTVCAIDDGRLVALDGVGTSFVAGSSPAEILASHDGKHLAVSLLGGNAVYTYAIVGDGKIVSARRQTAPGPFGGVFHPTEPATLFLSLAEPKAGQPAPGVASYLLGQGGHDFPRAAAVTDDKLQDPCWLAISPDGRQLWASSFIPRSLTRYEVGGGGTLRQAGSFTGDGKLGSVDIVVDPAGRFLYQLRAFGTSGDKTPPEIAILRIARDDGAHLAPAGSVVLPADLAGAGVAGLLVVDL